MSTFDLDHPPDGVVMLPTPGGKEDDRSLDPRAWVATVRLPALRKLDRRVADHLADARDLGEV